MCALLCCDCSSGSIESKKGATSLPKRVFGEMDLNWRQSISALSADFVKSGVEFTLWNKSSRCMFNETGSNSERSEFPMDCLTARTLDSASPCLLWASDKAGEKPIVIC